MARKPGDPNPDPRAPNPGRLCLLLCTLCLTLTASAGFYDPDQVNEIRLYFAESNWDELLDSMYARGLEERLIGDAVINGARYDSVGVRYKGNSSYNPNRKKNPFNIKLDHIRPDQKIEGCGTLRLANVFKDPSFVREVLSYEIARAYMPAGRANFTNIFVNDTLIGLYTNVEDVDKRFMRVHFLSDDNARFKGQFGDPVPAAGWRYYGSDTNQYRRYYELESDSGWAELIRFLDTLNNHTESVEEVLDVDRHLWMLAFDIILVNLDAPINMPQNYYLYRDNSGRFNPIVWDLNESFGAFRDLLKSGQLSLAQMQQLDPFLRAADPDYPIAGKLFSNSRFRRAYVAHCRTILADWFTENRYRTRAEQVQDAIDAHVRADPNKFYTYNDFHNNITRSVGSGPLAIVGLTELMTARTAYLLGRPEFQASPPVVSSLEPSPVRPRPHSSVTFTAQVSNADSVWLGWRQAPSGRLRRVKMTPEGADVYRAAVNVAAGDVSYFVYAENADAGAFLPERAEYELFRLPVADDVVINELMALNETTVQDPAGEYDDWVEFYNNSGSPVSLQGWYLSDDSTRPTKWTFPEATIPEHGYLIVWADEDLGQPGLHASFKLAGSGEVLILSRPDRTIADRVIFGQQYADISYGRWPNGTGPFIFMNPTFAAQNDSGVGLAEAEPTASLLRVRAFPNPFTRAATVRYTLPEPGRVSLRVYDASGRLAAVLAEGPRSPGRHEVSFAPVAQGRLPGGVYILQACFAARGGRTATETLKLVLTR